MEKDFWRITTVRLIINHVKNSFYDRMRFLSETVTRMIDSDTSENTYQQVSKKATRSMGWNYLSFGLKKLLNLVSVAILAHLLTP